MGDGDWQIDRQIDIHIEKVRGGMQFNLETKTASEINYCQGMFMNQRSFDIIH